jgi:hypothetical protein
LRTLAKASAGFSTWPSAVMVVLAMSNIGAWRIRASWFTALIMAKWSWQGKFE